MMKGRLIIDESLRDKSYVFDDREDAGVRLAEKLIDYYRKPDTLVLAIPAGGVPVAYAVARSLDLPMDVILSRKIQLPWNPEAGFGAMTVDGEIILNRALMNNLGWLTEEQIKGQINKTRDILKKRHRQFRAGKAFPDISGMTVILVDDGLASGYTMLAAIRCISKKNPGKRVVAVPTGSLNTVDVILTYTEELICLNLRGGTSYAVADAYKNWSDVDDEEVLSIMLKFRGNRGSVTHIDSD